ncbi:class E sortase [Streptomyces sp. NPDC047042]|uniref:class E sortase n=1 Tax=Streptomyces sp. NPDC047042 TaxID=3154807 RepID=UPI0033C27BBA
MRARAPAAQVVRHRTLRRRAFRRRALWTCGELLVTLGTVLALLVVHQLWWTNRQAEQGARQEVRALEREWGSSAGGGSDPADDTDGTDGTDGTGATGASGSGGSGGSSGSSGGAGTGSTRRTNSGSAQPSWSQAYAILTIPRLDLRVPVAEGVSKPDVLNKGYVGHYPGTQQPGQAGNFALAGHRNTHGEPFRYINRLRRGDAVQVETADAVYTYTVDRTLPQTSAHDDGAIRAVPRSTVRPAYGYRTPGYYLTLTTCTPEYTSRYRLVVWGKLTSMRLR